MGRKTRPWRGLRIADANPLPLSAPGGHLGESSALGPGGNGAGAGSRQEGRKRALFDMRRAGSQTSWPSSGIFLGDLDASRRVWAGCKLWYLHTIGSFFHAIPCHYLPPEEGPHWIWAAPVGW